MEPRFRQILLAGDSWGVPKLLNHIPHALVAGVIAASIRPEHLKATREAANTLGVPLLVQPRRSAPEFPSFLEKLIELQPDLLVCCSYSMIFPPKLLEVVAGQAFNVHSALLPKNRGPNPIQWAIIRGEIKTGVSFHQMDKGIDTGPILEQQEVPITLEDTWVTLKAKLDGCTDHVIQNGVNKLLSGNFTLAPQDEGQATQNPRLGPDSPEIDFAQMTDQEIHNWIRAQVQPLQGAFVRQEDGGRQHFPEPLSIEAVSELRRSHAR